eukprot:scaffold357_cov239-Pinguiococcus_pyrenoidosus.AAC.2
MHAAQDLLVQGLEPGDCVDQPAGHPDAELQVEDTRPHALDRVSFLHQKHLLRVLFVHVCAVVPRIEVERSEVDCLLQPPHGAESIFGEEVREVDGRVADRVHRHHPYPVEHLCRPRQVALLDQRHRAAVGGVRVRLLKLERPLEATRGMVQVLAVALLVLQVVAVQVCEPDQRVGVGPLRVLFDLAEAGLRDAVGLVAQVHVAPHELQIILLVAKPLDALGKDLVRLFHPPALEANQGEAAVALMHVLKPLLEKQVHFRSSLPEAPGFMQLGEGVEVVPRDLVQRNGRPEAQHVGPDSGVRKPLLRLDGPRRCRDPQHL